VICINTTIFAKIFFLFSLLASHKTLNNLVIFIKLNNFVIDVKDSERSLSTDFLFRLGLIFSVLFPKRNEKSGAPMIKQSLPEKVIVAITFIVSYHTVHTFFNVITPLFVAKKALS
jgi:hypothetical protein